MFLGEQQGRAPYIHRGALREGKEERGEELEGVAPARAVELAVVDRLANVVG